MGCLLQVFSEVSDKWELLHFDVGMATNPQAEQLQKEGSFAKANGQVRWGLSAVRHI